MYLPFIYTPDTGGVFCLKITLCRRQHLHDFPQGHQQKLVRREFGITYPFIWSLESIIIVVLIDFLIFDESAWFQDKFLSGYGSPGLNLAFWVMLSKVSKRQIFGEVWMPQMAAGFEKCTEILKNARVLRAPKYLLASSNNHSLYAW